MVEKKEQKVRAKRSPLPQSEMVKVKNLFRKV
jgi:hypothetical protein